LVDSEKHRLWHFDPHFDPHRTKSIEDVVGRAKNFPPKKSVEIVLSVCEDILCQPLDGLSSSDKDIFLGVLAQYTLMKRQLNERSTRQKSKSGKER